MDNISGKANWFAQDVQEEVEEIVIEEPYIQVRNISLLNEFILACEKDYHSKKDKVVGDALIHLKIAQKQLN